MGTLTYTAEAAKMFNTSADKLQKIPLAVLGGVMLCLKKEDQNNPVHNIGAALVSNQDIHGPALIIPGGYG